MVLKKKMSKVAV